MTEEQAKQFAKRPPAQYRRPEFYFRGGDVLREQEYLHEEYKKALSEYRIAQQRYRQVQEEVQDATDVLAEREGYTNALASYLERDTKAATTESKMKKHLTEVEHEIADVEQQLRIVKAFHNPASLAALQKEKAHYLIEIQKGNRTIQSQEEQKDDAIRQIAACTVNGRYRNALYLEYLYDKTQSKKKYLRDTVRSCKNHFDSMKPVTPLQDQDSRFLRLKLSRGIDNRVVLLRNQERAERRQVKHRNHINNLLDQIRELNDRMVEIGIEDDQVDIEEFRERVLNEDYSEDEIPEEEEEHEEEEEVVPVKEPPKRPAKKAPNQARARAVKQSPPPPKEEEPKEDESEFKDDEFDETGSKESGSDDEKKKSMSGDFDDESKKSESNAGKSMSNDFSESKKSEKDTSDRETSEKESSERETSDKETSERETSERETSERETSDKETSDRESSEKETSERETSGKETSERESSEKETSDKETSDRESDDEEKKKSMSGGFDDDFE